MEPMRRFLALIFCKHDWRECVNVRNEMCVRCFNSRRIILPTGETLTMTGNSSDLNVTWTKMSGCP